MAFLDKVKEVAKTVGDKTSEAAKVVGAKTSEAAKVVGNKTNETIEITKLKSKISSEKSSVAEIKKQIGELVWEEYAAGETFSDNIAVLCASIKEHEEAIAKAEADIAAKKVKPEAVETVVEETVEETVEAVEEVKEEKTEE